MRIFARVPETPRTHSVAPSRPASTPEASDGHMSIADGGAGFRAIRGAWKATNISSRAATDSSASATSRTGSPFLSVRFGSSSGPGYSRSSRSVARRASGPATFDPWSITGQRCRPPRLRSLAHARPTEDRGLAQRYRAAGSRPPRAGQEEWRRLDGPMPSSRRQQSQSLDQPGSGRQGPNQMPRGVLRR